MCRHNTPRKEDFYLRDGWRHCSPWVLLSTHSPASSLWPSLRAKRARCKRSRRIDRKSTRLSSSHITISYAVFCLKKKKKKTKKQQDRLINRSSKATYTS